MDNETISFLNNLTSQFYAEEASSFSSTRQKPWAGWSHLDPYLSLLCSQALREDRGAIRVLDVGAGNKRFLTFLKQQCVEFLASEFENQDDESQQSPVLTYHSLDNNSFPQEISATQDQGLIKIEQSHEHLDIIQELLAQSKKKPTKNSQVLRSLTTDWDLVVAFGVFHHIPTVQLREKLLRLLVQKLTPGGHLIISLWRFASVKKRRKKAEVTTEQALECYPQLQGQLEEGDYLLGWQHADRIFRFCHSFSPAEIKNLIEIAQADGAALVSKFEADGREGNLNTYLVLRRL